MSSTPLETEKVLAQDAFHAVLNRRKIPNGQMDMYKVPSEGELEYNEYLRQMGRTAQEIAGLHGSLGRRINSTPEIHKAGLMGNMGDIVVWWQDRDNRFLSLKPEFIEMLKDEGAV